MQALIVWLASTQRRIRDVERPKRSEEGVFGTEGLDWFVHTTVGFVFAVLGTGRNHS